jgi:hypothetical protein
LASIGYKHNNVAAHEQLGMVQLHDLVLPARPLLAPRAAHAAV